MAPVTLPAMTGMSFSSFTGRGGGLGCGAAKK